MQIQLNSFKNNTPVFGQNLGDIQFKNTKDLMFSSKENQEAGSKTSSMIIAGDEIKSGDTFYIMKPSGDIQKAEFAGAFKTLTSCDERGESTIEIILKESNAEKTSRISTRYSEFMQVFSKKGLEQLHGQLTKLLRK